MFNNYDLEDLIMRLCLILLAGFLILLIVVGIASIFIDFNVNKFIEIKYNDGNCQIYRQTSRMWKYESYLEFDSEGTKYTIFYKDIKSVREYREDVAQGIYSTRK